MEKVLVLAGGFPQIELIKKLKSRGYFVLLADWNENPVAKEYCDKYYKESTLDVSADQLLVDSLPQNKNDLNSLLLDCTPEEVNSGRKLYRFEKGTLKVPD